MFNIKMLNKISPAGTDVFDKSKYTVALEADDPDAIMVRSAAMHDMEFGKNLKAIARAGAGVNNIPIDRCSEAGIVVFNTPGANANAVKELAVCALLLASRKIVAGANWAQSLKGNVEDVAKAVEKGKSEFVGPELAGKTLGVIGLGAIGTLVAEGAKALGMDIVGYNPKLSEERIADLTSKGIKLMSSLDELYAVSDYITLHLPLNDSTRGMINGEAIAKMKDGVRILNFARGELVDSDALIAALGSGKAAAYVTDFPTDAQIGVDGVTAIPHLGASTPESEENCAAMAAVEIADYLEKGAVKNSVNLPNTNLPESFESRTCFIHNEDEAFGTKVTAAAAAQGAAVKNLFTASKKGLGYTVIDTDKPLDVSGIEAIRIRAL